MKIGGIIKDAKCISKSNLKIICPGSNRTLTCITAWNTNFYFDGVQKYPSTTARHDSRNTSTIPFSGDLQVIGIKSTNTFNSYHGIIASTDDDYILTNSTWKCRNKLHENWADVNYNDSHWQNATNFSVTYNRSVIRNQAQWIWTINWSDDTVYCRLCLGRYLSRHNHHWHTIPQSCPRVGWTSGSGRVTILPDFCGSGRVSTLDF